MIRYFLLPSMISNGSVLALLNYGERIWPPSVWSTDEMQSFDLPQWTEKLIKIWEIAYAHGFLRWATFPIDFSLTFGDHFLLTAQVDLDICHALCSYGL